nr:MAG TPA: hypothetical protein [Caudoviricetes sp.]
MTNELLALAAILSTASLIILLRIIRKQADIMSYHKPESTYHVIRMEVV